MADEDQGTTSTTKSEKDYVLPQSAQNSYDYIRLSLFRGKDPLDKDDHLKLKQYIKQKYPNDQEINDIAEQAYRESIGYVNSDMPSQVAMANDKRRDENGAWNVARWKRAEAEKVPSEQNKKSSEYGNYKQERMNSRVKPGMITNSMKARSIATQDKVSPLRSQTLMAKEEAYRDLDAWMIGHGYKQDPTGSYLLRGQ